LKFSNPVGKVIVTFGDLVFAETRWPSFLNFLAGLKRYENMSALMEEMAAKFGPEAGRKE